MKPGHHQYRKARNMSYALWFDKLIPWDKDVEPDAYVDGRKYVLRSCRRFSEWYITATYTLEELNATR